MFDLQDVVFLLKKLIFLPSWKNNIPAAYYATY